MQGANEWRSRDKCNSLHAPDRFFQFLLADTPYLAVKVSTH